MTSVAPTQETLKPGAMIGPYTVLRPLGLERPATVYQVQRDQRVLVLKRVTREAPNYHGAARVRDEELGKRELAALLTVHHPNLVRVHGVEWWPSIEDGEPYLVMDYVEGVLFPEWFAGRPTMREVTAIYQQVMRGLAELHRLGVKHRNVRPDNFICCPDGRAVLIGIGVVRRERTVYIGLSRDFPIRSPEFITPGFARFLESGTDAFDQETPGRTDTGGREYVLAGSSSRVPDCA